MLVYEYDGTIEGLFTCVFEARRRKESPQNITCFVNENEDLFARYVDIKTDKANADRVAEYIRKHLPRTAWKNIFYAFLSEVEGVEIFIYEYIMFGIKTGKKLDEYVSEKRVKNIHDLVRKVGYEAHRMCGFIRFEELEDNMCYSVIEPDHYILPLIRNHFTQRFPDQKWMIYDSKRGKAIFYDKKKCDIYDIRINYDPDTSEDEKRFQALWRMYFKEAAIKERKNLKVQKQYMPKRYWKNITEMK